MIQLEQITRSLVGRVIGGGGPGPQALGGGIESRGNLMTSGRSVGQPEELSAPGGFISSRGLNGLHNACSLAPRERKY